MGPAAPAASSPWAAPVASRPVTATVRVPGSKSATARALVLSGLADGPGSITGGLVARDTRLMMDGLRQLSAVVEETGPATWRVQPISQLPDQAVVDCGLAGTVMRFLPPIAALGLGTTRFVGDPAASARPMAPLVEALIQLGARVDDDRLPLSVTGPVNGRRVVIDASSSSQFVSALLLAAPRLPQGLDLHHRGGPLPSRPHIDMTVQALAARGVVVRQTATSWRVEAGPVAAREETIEPDLSTAAVFLAAALVTGGEVTVPDWPDQTSQPGALLLPLLTQMGAEVQRSSGGLTVRGGGRIAGVEVDLHQASELTPVVTALAALAEGDSLIRGVAHIRGHETDRLAALSGGITALGGDCRQTVDGLVIHPRPLRAGLFPCFADHRLAQAGALLGLRVAGVELDDVACTSKTMPDFPQVWKAMVR